jgi:hypothetical protein
MTLFKHKGEGGFASSIFTFVFRLFPARNGRAEKINSNFDEPEKTGVSQSFAFRQ